MTRQTQNQLFSLGDINFSTTKCSDSFSEDVRKLFFSIEDSPALISDTPIFYYESSHENIRNLIDAVLKLHPHCLWIDAATLITPDNKKILLTGKSGAGKSTTTLALALQHDWKMVAEDVLLIDRADYRLLNFASPCSLKGDAAELLHKTTGKPLSNVIDNEWLKMGDLANLKTFHAPFDVAIHLNLAYKNQPLMTERLSASEFCRTILPNSNALRIPDGINDVQNCLRDTACFKMTSGALVDRLDQITRLAYDQEFAKVFGTLSSPQSILESRSQYTRSNLIESTLNDDGSLTIAFTQTRQGFKFSPLGALVFEFCDGSNTPAQIADEIKKLFPDYDKRTLQNEVAELLFDLESKQIVEPVALK